ncbi:MAG: CBS domain-containing protein [Chloroflexota bacterium]|nr:CBS domain-containing protein [Chloroflexota bacterium]
MSIRDIVTTNVQTVDPDATIFEVAQLMRDVDTGVVPVVSGGLLAGVLTDRDIVVRVIADGADPRTARVNDYMTRNPTTVTLDTGIQQAAQLMQRDQVRRLPVVQGPELVGIISIGDLAVDTDKDRLVGDTLEEISRPAAPDLPS